MNLTTVDGVDEEAAETLRDHNIDYLEDLAGACCLDVKKMGLSSEIVADALRKAHYPDTFVEPDKISYECEYCEETFAGIQSNKHDVHVRLKCERRPEAQEKFTEEVR